MLAERDISAFQPLVVPRIQKKQPVVFASCLAGSDIMRDGIETRTVDLTSVKEAELKASAGLKTCRG